jgi:hypothetical protein
MRAWRTTVAVLALLAATPAAAMAGRWSIVKVQSVAGQKDGNLSAVSCAGRLRCVSVGGYTNGHSVFEGLAYGVSGTRFTFRRSPTRIHPQFLGVSCPTISMCIGVGSPQAHWADELRHGSWRALHLSVPAGRLSTLRAVSCASRRMCMAVGFVAYKNDHSDPIAERWDGHRWSVRKLPEPAHAGFGGELNGVSCPTERTCLAVGDVNPGEFAKMLVEHWDGHRWRVAGSANPRGSEQELDGVSCTSASWCEAVGTVQKDSLGDSVAVVEHWGGKRFALEHIAAPPGAERSQFRFTAVSCATRGSCMAAGVTSLGTLGITLTERLRHGRWSLQRTPNPRLGGELDGISCSRDGRCLAVGNQQTSADPFSPTAQLAEKYS